MLAVVGKPCHDLHDVISHFLVERYDIVKVFSREFRLCRLCYPEEFVVIIRRKIGNPLFTASRIASSDWNTCLKNPV